jgi:hypothetical protein
MAVTLADMAGRRVVIAGRRAAMAGRKDAMED